MAHQFAHSGKAKLKKKIFSYFALFCGYREIFFLQLHVSFDTIRYNTTHHGKSDIEQISSCAVNVRKYFDTNYSPSHFIFHLSSLRLSKPKLASLKQIQTSSEMVCGDGEWLKLKLTANATREVERSEMRMKFTKI
jgi:hypothetical protein